MKRLTLLLLGALAAMLAFAIPAAAHVTVNSPGATQGGYAVLTFRVPTESATASTTKLTVQLPPFASVSLQPMVGWTEATKTSKLAKPITTDDGDQVSSAVTEVSWTAQAGSGIKPGQFQQFNVQVGPLPKSSTVTFKALQTYSDGSVVKWIEVPAPGSTAEPEHPAPTLTLQPAAGSASAAPSAASTGDDAASTSSSDTGPVVLSIVALVIAAAALGVAIVSRARSRR